MFTYGVSFPTSGGIHFTYMACTEVDSPHHGLPEGMTHLEIPGGTYPVFRRPCKLGKVSRLAELIYGVWLPSSGYSLNFGVEVEVYDERWANPESEELEVELWIIILLVVIGIVTVMKKNIGDGKQEFVSLSRMRAILILLLGIAIGFYEGFFGPGTGIIIVFSFITWLGYSYVKASGSAKAISFVGNIAAFITYALHGDVRWFAGLVMAFAVSIGAYVGALFAQRGGRKVIRPVMLGVIVLLVMNVLSSFFPHDMKFL